MGAIWRHQKIALDDYSKQMDGLTQIVLPPITVDGGPRVWVEVRQPLQRFCCCLHQPVEVVSPVIIKKGS